MIKWLRDYLDSWKPDREAARMVAQAEAMEDVQWLLDNTDMRLGQIISGAVRGTNVELFYITDEDMAVAINDLCSRTEGSS